ncbi:MAG: hypothetical protein AAFW70_30610, partial [Cyanobacteria bacterium J06635_10]
MNSQSSNKLFSIKKFAQGVLGGIFLSAILWLCAIYAHASISLNQGIICSSVIVISCAITATLRGVTRRFAVGLLGGFYLAAILWLYSTYFNVPISLAQGIIGISVVGISCGILASVSG